MNWLPWAATRRETRLISKGMCVVEGKCDLQLRTARVLKMGAIVGDLVSVKNVVDD